jgi:N-acetylneuraminic acid mutarotase
VYAIKQGSELLEYSLESRQIEVRNLALPMLSEAGVTCVGPNLMFAGGIQLSYEEVALCYLVKTVEAQAVQLPDLPLPRRRLRLCYDGQDSVFAVGGVRESVSKHNKGIQIDYTMCFTKFSFSSNSWVDLPNLSIPVESPGVCYYLDQVYVFGGFNGNGCVDAVQHFSSLSEQWNIAEVSLPEPLHSLLAVEVEGEVLVFGGLDEEDEPNYRSFTYAKNKFRKSASLPSEVSPIFPSYGLSKDRSVWVFNEEFRLLSWREGQWQCSLKP